MRGSAEVRCRSIFSHEMQCEIDELIEVVSIGLLLLGHGIEPQCFFRPPKSDSFNFWLTQISFIALRLYYGFPVKTEGHLGFNVFLLMLRND